VLTNAPVAAKIGQTEALATQLNAPLIYADVTKMEDMENLVSESVAKLGGKLDFVLHSVGMSLNVRKKVPYTELNYDWMHTTIDISAISFHRLMQVLWKQDAINGMGKCIGPNLYCCSTGIPRLQRNGRCKIHVGKYCKKF
jgi:enoyl-[acyl-carrier protein] reductase I